MVYPLYRQVVSSAKVSSSENGKWIIYGAKCDSPIDRLTPLTIRV